ARHSINKILAFERQQGFTYRTAAHFYCRGNAQFLNAFTRNNFATNNLLTKVLSNLLCEAGVGSKHEVLLTDVLIVQQFTCLVGLYYRSNKGVVFTDTSQGVIKGKKVTHRICG